MSDEYNWRITLWKGVQYALFFGVPTLIEYVLMGNPSWASMTVGGLLVMLANYLKHRNK